ncbi:IclR family transcriptional regulator [Streptomyces sp. SID13726]|uniref:IclR family transcriptional regulator n=1 Tax=Streptomyces sp. SID13726 TaxID=2706058 RepID=UPI0013BB47FE|nr:IclR family transcriptional regulator [Streptomyces sp. SID13726]NEB03422.1 IclR family transcriptional regulator [Streptomyces sp. SID13726]
MISPHSRPTERSVVDRTLSILDSFDRDHPCLTLSDISRRSRLPVATVHRIVSKLAGWGALERNADGAYRIGLRLWEMAELAPRCASLAEGAQPYLVSLHVQTSAAAFIAIRDGNDVLCPSFVSSDPRAAAYFGTRGRRLPAHATSAGLVLLAYGGEEVLDAVCGGVLRAFTPATITDAEVLRNRLSTVRRQGYALVQSTLVDGRGSLSVPLRDSRGAVVAAIGVVGPVAVIEPMKLLPHVRGAADAISRHIEMVDGCRPSEVGS